MVVMMVMKISNFVNVFINKTMMASLTLKHEHKGVVKHAIELGEKVHCVDGREGDHQHQHVGDHGHAITAGHAHLINLGGLSFDFLCGRSGVKAD